MSGRVRWQFTHAKVQNSSRTTRSRTAASLSGSPSGVLNHGSTPTSSGARPRTANRRTASSSIGARGVFRGVKVITRLMVAADEVTAIALGDRKIACTDWNCDARRHLSADAHHVVVTVRTADEAAGSPLSIARDAIS